MRLLIVEDEQDLARQMSEALRAADYAVDVAEDGEEAQYLGEVEPYDAVILDLGLPVVDGLTVLRRWRQAGRTMPVLILTARDTWSEKVEGFDAGAELLAQAADEDLDGVGVAVEVLVVDVLGQLGARHHLVLVVHQVGDDLVLMGGEPDRGAVQRHPAGAGVDAHWPAFQFGRGQPGGAANQRADARQHLLDV